VQQQQQIQVLAVYDSEMNKDVGPVPSGYPNPVKRNTTNWDARCEIPDVERGKKNQISPGPHSSLTQQIERERKSKKDKPRKEEEEEE